MKTSPFLKFIFVFMKKILSLLIVLCLSCEDERYNIDDYPNQIISDPSGACISGEIAGAVASGNNIVLVWADEFDVDGIRVRKIGFMKPYPPTMEVGGMAKPVLHQQAIQLFCRGWAVTYCTKESYKGKNFTSARLVTNKLFDFTYGKVEVHYETHQWDEWYMACHMVVGRILKQTLGLPVVKLISWSSLVKMHLKSSLQSITPPPEGRLYQSDNRRRRHI